MTALLESLPVELQILVLEQIPDLPSLHSLTCASSTYRRTYLRSSKSVLHQLVSRAYGLVDISDAIAAVDSVGLHAENESNRGEIVALLDRRRRHAELPRSRLASEIQSVKLLHLYETLDHVLQAYCSQPRLSQISLSPVERARILRALCRLQTYCNVFGTREWAESQGERRPTWHRHFTIDEMWSLFFRTMPPWEIEEFGSIWTFVRQMYSDLFVGISRDFPRNSPEWRALRPATMPMDPSELYGSEDEEEYNTNDDYDDYCNHLVALGPSFLSKVLRQPDDCARRRLLACNSVTAKSSFMDVVSVVTSHQPLLHPADRYEANDIASTLATLPETAQPAPSWKRHWYGHRPVDQVMYAIAIQDPTTLSPQEAGPPGEVSYQRTIGFFPGWAWGYAFWD